MRRFCLILLLVISAQTWCIYYLGDVVRQSDAAFIDGYSAGFAATNRCYSESTDSM